ncbi:hypothetical protein [Brevundimonas naejangsanensis]|uniref:hypothetical protein n=1 Tax=Brevundimonas naejangsanensis TaxID=588932 RepID=UPI0026EBAF59|nr:hypothetical protein [Brevundimonas naejangsanensis]
MTAWGKFQNDFNAMTDNDAIDETRRMENQLDEAEGWLEAVAAWEHAGKPRSPSDKERQK